jgi:hypothetical protein
MPLLTVSQSLVRGIPLAVSEERALQKLYQTLDE